MDDEQKVQLKSLNYQFLDHIKSNMEKNSLITLSNVFEDYNNYLSKIQKEKELDEEKEVNSVAYTQIGFYHNS